MTKSKCSCLQRHAEPGSKSDDKISINFSRPQTKCCSLQGKAKAIKQLLNSSYTVISTEGTSKLKHFTSVLNTHTKVFLTYEPLAFKAKNMYNWTDDISLQRHKDAAKMLWVWNSKQNWNIFLHIHTSPTFFAAQHLMASPTLPSSDRIFSHFIENLVRKLTGMSNSPSWSSLMKKHIQQQ